MLCGLVTLLALATSLLLSKNIDFRVYWYGARAVFDTSRPLYGPSSGLGFPMHYRYPPVTYLLLWPFSQMPLYWSGVFWMLATWAAVSIAVVRMVRVARLHFAGCGVVAAAAYMLAYAVLAIRSGNVQPCAIALILSAMYLSESHRVAAASLMALAISFKIWPVFFLPWFLRKGRRMVLVWQIPTLLLLWTAPLLVWSRSRYLTLLWQWYSSELQTATTNSELWYFPGQSLRGVALRYFTQSDPWLKGFPDLHVLSLPAGTVVAAWKIIAGAVYTVICLAMLRSDWTKRWIWDGISFALFTVLEPFCLKSSMISLGPAVLVAAALLSAEVRGERNSGSTLATKLFLCASALSMLGAIAQYKPLLRLLLTVGVDFYAEVLLLAALLIWALKEKSDSEFGGARSTSLEQRWQSGIRRPGAEHQILHRDRLAK